MSTEGGSPGSMRTGGKVNYEPSPGQMQFLEVGVNIDCRWVREVEGQLTLDIAADISSVAFDAGSPPKPVLRQVKWSSKAIVPLRKATLLFSSDDVTGKRKLQLELTATPVK
jgi:hypothetical protein